MALVACACDFVHSFHWLAEAKHQSSAHAIVSCALLYVAMSTVGIRALAENRV